MRSTRKTFLTLAVMAVAMVAGLSVLVAETVDNHIVVRVNNRIATLVDYQLQRDDRLRAMAAADIPPDQRDQILDTLGESVMADLVEELLMLSRADQLGISAPRAAVDQEMAAARGRAGASTDDEFQVALARAGMNEEDLRSQIENNLIVRQVISREVVGQIEITEEDLRRYYFENADEFTVAERRKVREFVLSDTAGTAEERSQAATRIQEAIAGGADPVTTVAEEPLAGAWFELGWVERSDLEVILADAAWGLTEGQISHPVEGRGGLHVLQVLEVTAPELIDFQDVREQIGAREQQRIFAENYDGYVDDLRRDSYVQINEMPDDAKDFDIEASAQRVTLNDLEVADDLAGEASSEEAEVAPEETAVSTTPAEG